MYIEKLKLSLSFDQQSNLSTEPKYNDQLIIHSHQLISIINQSQVRLILAPQLNQKGCIQVIFFLSEKIISLSRFMLRSAIGSKIVVSILQLGILVFVLQARHYALCFGAGQCLL